MLTGNFKSLVGSMVQSTSVVKGTLPVKDVYGMQYFVTGQYSSTFPSSRTITFATDRFAAGISIGSGSDPVLDSDYQLASPILSGMTASVTANSVEVNDGEPYVQYNVTVTNTSSSDLTIAEICYKQSVSATAYSGATSASNVVTMIDRTLVEPAIVIPPSRAAVIEYRLKTVMPEKTVNGVKIVSWQYGSDEDVASMIDAALAGDIDLHEDGGWGIGDVRPITVGAFSAGGKSHASEVIGLAISSFDDYNGCGCIMQLDFMDALSTTIRMNSTGTNSGGYGASEMYATTLPSIMGAMPEWLVNRLRTFDVTVLSGGGSTSIETVQNNKLALRAEVEVDNTTTSPFVNESSAIAWFLSGNKMRQRKLGRTGSSTEWWMRSPHTNTTQWRTMRSQGDYGTYESATSAYGVAPFMCI